MSGPVIDAPDLGSEHLVVEVRGRVLHVRVNRPERRNAFALDIYRGIKRAAIWADEQPELDAVCLTGTDTWFGSGGDMSASEADTLGLGAEWDRSDHYPFRHIERCSKIWVCQVNGLCFAGGINMLLHSDVVIASDQARFRVPELLRGIPDPYMSGRLAQVVGLAWAKYLFFTAEEFDAHAAHEMGLVGKVVPHAELDAETDRVLAAIGSTGPSARAAIKRDLNRHLPAHDADMLRHTSRQELIEGITAFLDKRPVNWPRG